MVKQRAWAIRSVGEIAQWEKQQSPDSTRPALIDKLVRELSAASGMSQFAVTSEQQWAWEESGQVMADVLRDLVEVAPDTKDWAVFFEYPIPRRETRPDVVLLGPGFVVVIEFKAGATSYPRADRLQADDYAKDLRDFHEESHGLLVIPVLCATAADSTYVDLSSDSAACQVQLVNTKSLSTLLAKAHRRFGKGPLINHQRWDQSRYRPTPGIVETALDVFSGQQVREISHAYADNLTATVDELQQIIEQARERSERVVCFVTGVPGSGKTLAGLAAVHKATGDDQLTVLGTYLSGNGPLVDVLRYALSRDLHQREQIRMSDATRRASVMVQMVHHFVRELATTERPPPENVIVFDEAQRAWDAKQMERKQRISSSEAQVTFDIMSRTPNWAAVIALVGEGQEINSGEAGIQEWTKALTDFPDWKIYVSPHVNHQLGSRPTESLGLHLSVGARAPRAKYLADWVDAVVAGKSRAARDALAANQDYPILLTRDLEVARAYLRDRASPDRRTGLLASAQARRLRALGIEMSNDFQSGIHWPRWFVDGPNDIRSSYQLEVAASEFKCQGLEIDWVGLCWGSDFTWDPAANEWNTQRMVGPKWVTDKDKTRATNRYRVLLSRARYGMVIWVPRPPEHIPLIDTASLDATATFLEACGVEPLE